MKEQDGGFISQESLREKSWTEFRLDDGPPKRVVVKNPELFEEGPGANHAFYRVRLSGAFSEGDYAGRLDIVNALLEDEKKTAHHAKRTVTRAPCTAVLGTEDDALDVIAQLENSRYDAGNPDVMAWPYKDERRFYARFRKQARTQSARPAQPRATPNEPVTCAVVVRIVDENDRDGITQHPNREELLSTHEEPRKGAVVSR